MRQKDNYDTQVKRKKRALKYETEIYKDIEIQEIARDNYDTQVRRGTRKANDATIIIRKTMQQ